MWHALAWGLIAVLMAVWTLGAWALHALVQWASGRSAEQFGAQGEAAVRQVVEHSLPDWLTVWWPADAIAPWTELLHAITPWVQSLLSQTPAFIAWLSPLVWFGWAVGALLLLLLGGGSSLLIRLLQGTRPALRSAA